MHDSKSPTFITELFELRVERLVRIRIDFSKQKQNFSFIFANITLLLVDMMDGISENQTISDKEERRQKYSIEFKKATIRHALENSIQRNSKSIEKESVSGSKRKRK